MDIEQKLISLCDQVQATLKDIFKEKGYDVEVDAPKLVSGDEEEGFKLSINCRSKNGLRGDVEVDQETIQFAIQEAISRVGGFDQLGGKLNTSFENVEEDENEWWKR